MSCGRAPRSPSCRTKLHSIHVEGDDRVVNFHMYGLALDHLHARDYYRADDHSWRNFPAQQDIIDARGV